MCHRTLGQHVGLGGAELPRAERPRVDAGCCERGWIRDRPSGPERVPQRRDSRWDGTKAHLGCKMGLRVGAAPLGGILGP